MKKIFTILGFSLSMFLNAQIRVANSATITPIGGSSAFIDATSSSTLNATVNLGKGLAFPRVNLVNFTAFGSAFAGNSSAFPTRFDGMLVFNSETGTSGIGSVAVKPGFYYYRNTSTTAGGGTWMPVGSGNLLLSGTAAPVNGKGSDGDFFIDTTINKIYGPKVAGVWPATGILVGGADYTGTGSIDITNRVVSLNDASVSLTAKVAGILPVANGGTGAIGLEGFVKGNGANAFTTISTIPVANVSGAVRQVNGSTPDANGNVAIAFGKVTTGALLARPSGTGTSGDIYVVSNDTTKPADNGRTFIYDGSNWLEVTSNQGSTDNRYVKLSGAVMEGDLNFPTSRKITIVDAPTGSTDVANKKYTDDAVILGTPEATLISKGKIKLAGDLEGTADLPRITNAAVIAKVITGYASAAGELAATDNIVVALNKLNGNDAFKAPLASPVFTGNPTAPTAAELDNSVTLATTAFVTTAVTSATPDGSPAIKGKIQLSGDLAGTADKPAITNAAVIGKVLTGFSSAAGVVLATDNIVTAFSRLDGNVAVKAPLASPVLSGKPVAPTANVGDNSAQIATTEFVSLAIAAGATAGATPDASATIKGKILLTGELSGTASLPTISNDAVIGKFLNGYASAEGTVSAADNIVKAIGKLNGNVAVKAPLASPVLTGTPTAPTASAEINNMQIATTAFVKTAVAAATIPDASADVKGKIRLTGELAGTADAPTLSNAAVTGKFLTNYASTTGVISDTDNILGAIGKLNGNVAVKAPLASPGLTGTPVAPTATPGDNSKQIATTEFVGLAIAAGATAGATPDASATGKGKIQLAGELAGTADAPTLKNDAVIGKFLTNYASATGVVSATDNIVGAIGKLNGNDALKAPLASPALTGTPVAPTAAADTNNFQIATTAFVKTAVTAVPNATTAVLGKIQLAGELAGTADAPTLKNDAVIGKFLTNYASATGVVSATDNIVGAIGKLNGNDALKAPLASPALTGTPVAPTAAADTNNFQIATTAFVNAAVTAIPNATTAILGKIMLAGDLAGIATAPAIGDNKVTYAKIQKVKGVRLLGNPTATDAVPAEITVGRGLNLSVLGELTASGVAGYARVTADYTVKTTDYVLSCNAASAGFTLTLPAATTLNIGTVLVIKKMDETSNVLTFSAPIYPSDVLANAFTTLNYNKALWIASNGSNWIQIN